MLLLLFRLEVDHWQVHQGTSSRNRAAVQVASSCRCDPNKRVDFFACACAAAVTARRTCNDRSPVSQACCGIGCAIASKVIVLGLRAAAESAQ